MSTGNKENAKAEAESHLEVNEVMPSTVSELSQEEFLRLIEEDETSGMKVSQIGKDMFFAIGPSPLDLELDK